MNNVCFKCISPIILVACVLAIGSLSCSRSSQHNPSSGTENASEKDEGNTNNPDNGNSDSEDAKANKKRTEKLFIIERSKNANIVRYDAQITSEGKLNPDEPVIAYWILKADKGQRAELSMLQKKYAYGFSTKPASSGEGYVMKMVPLPKREIKIKLVENKARAVVKINGHPAVVDKIYVDSEAGWTGPDVQYVKLFGKDVKTGEKRTEKIIPD